MKKIRTYLKYILLALVILCTGNTLANYDATNSGDMTFSCSNNVLKVIYRLSHKGPQIRYYKTQGPGAYCTSSGVCQTFTCSNTCKSGHETITPGESIAATSSDDSASGLLACGSINKSIYINGSAASWTRYCSYVTSGTPINVGGAISVQSSNVTLDRYTSPTCQTIAGITINKWDGNISDEGGIDDPASITANDTQNITGTTAEFTIAVKNTGAQALKNVSITDALASACSRTSAEILSLAPRYRNTVPGATQPSTNTDNFDPGESFIYTCSQTSITSTTFPNLKNYATVKADKTSGTGQVTDTDSTNIDTINTCTTTKAPTIIPANNGQPFIGCTGGNASQTHARYTITSTSPAYNFSSSWFTKNTEQKHTQTLAAGTYSVTCFYGDSTNAGTSGGTEGCDITTLSQAPDIVEPAPRCLRLTTYAGSTLSAIPLSSNNPFTGHIACQSSDSLPDNASFEVKIGSGPFSPVGFSDTLYGLGIRSLSGFVDHAFGVGNTTIECRIRTPRGTYTSGACSQNISVCPSGSNGPGCDPKTFIITPSQEAICTNQTDFTYDFGCNENSSDYAQCTSWLNDTTASYTRNIQVKFNGNTEQRTVTCTTSTPPGALGPVKNCTISLPTGGTPVTVFSGDANSFQTTLYSLTKDIQNPAGTINYYTNYTPGSTNSPVQNSYWQKQGLTAVITCTDNPGTSDGTSCACASTLGGTTASLWSDGVRNASDTIGPDIMTYTRFLSNNSSSVGQEVIVRDTAGNVGPSFGLDIGIDSVAPHVVLSQPSSGQVRIAASDILSKLWKPTVPASISQNATQKAIVYRVGTKANYLSNPSNLEFSDNCSIPPNSANYFKYTGETDTPSQSQQIDIAVTGLTSSFDTTTNIVAYCVQDNAGNVSRGVYPNDPVGCFSATNMSPVPTLSTYAALTQTRWSSTTQSNNQKYGYSLSEDVSNASCFSGLLASNINTLIKNQYSYTSLTTNTLMNWDNTALILNGTQKNTNGYYYYKNTSNSATPLLTLGDTVLNTTTNKPRVVYTEGVNIQITKDQIQTNTNNTLIIIAKTDSNGRGGNIYIDPLVMRIDAILIADGALQNAQNGTVLNWINDPGRLLSNRLEINGRLYSFNTRGGSFMISGTDINPITGNTGKYFSGANLLGNGSPAQSAAVDLEHMRMIANDGDSTCSMTINYQSFGTGNIPPILQRPNNFSGGSCTF